MSELAAAISVQTSHISPSAGTERWERRHHKERQQEFILLDDARFIKRYRSGFLLLVAEDTAFVWLLAFIRCSLI